MLFYKTLCKLERACVPANWSNYFLFFLKQYEVDDHRIIFYKIINNIIYYFYILISNVVVIND